LRVTSDEDAASIGLAEMRAIAAGDSAAFRRLIERESPRLLRFALGMLGSLEEAEDVVQEALLSLWENAATWRPEARIGTWLYRVSYNRAIDRLRRRRNFVDDSVLIEFPDAAEPPDLRLVRGEAVHDLREAVARLAPRQRTAVLLFHFQELPQREVAEIMGISEPALESLLARARRRMRFWLGVEGDHDE
jgi:RNA polymerase sigma-70 factor (ECF subfamily)